MSVAKRHSWFFAVAGAAGWIAAGVPLLLYPPVSSPPAGESPLNWVGIGAFLLFGVVLAAVIFDKGHPSRRQWILLGLQSASLLVMALYSSTLVIFPLLVLVAWQATLMMHLYAALALVLLQTLILCFALFPLWRSTSCQIMLGIYLAFQVFAIFAARVVRVTESEGQELARVNAELRATRALLADAARAEERVRISRELHDAWGHDLTALNLQLEVASHLTGDAVREGLTEARNLSRALMGKVRDVVGTLRIDENCDIASILKELVAYLPKPAVHLSVPPGIQVHSASQAQVLIRCVQEVITNTIKHADAGNLWLELQQDGDGVRIVARDDGRGASAVTLGNGLSGMRDRFEELGGRLVFETGAGSGFSLDGWLPQSRPAS